MPDILSLGEPMAEFSEEPNGGWVQALGGDTMNVAVAAARQGATVGYMTRLGEDTFGDRMIALLRDEGVSVDVISRSSSEPTAIYFITHGEDGHTFTYYRHGSAASAMTPADLDQSAIKSAKLLHVSGISQAISQSASETVSEAISVANQAGVLVSYDTNLRLKLWSLDVARRVIHAAVAKADIALPGLDDAQLLTGLETPDQIADFYLGLGPSVVALTLGKEGTLVATTSDRQMVEAFPVEAIDAAGAGDCFDGAFLAELIAGSHPFEAARYANATAALSTLGYGTISPIPRRETVIQFLKERG